MASRSWSCGGFVVAVVVVGVVGLPEAPVAAGYQRVGRQPAVVAEVPADAAHRRGLAGHPDPCPGGDVGGPRRLVQFGAERAWRSPVMPADRGLGRAVERDLV